MEKNFFDVVFLYKCIDWYYVFWNKLDVYLNIIYKYLLFFGIKDYFMFRKEFLDFIELKEIVFFWYWFYDD